MQLTHPFGGRRPRLTFRRTAIAIAAVTMVAAGLTQVAWATAAYPPFYKSGTNGFAAPSKGASLLIDEGDGGQGALLTSVSGAANQAGFGRVGVHFSGTFSQLTDVETQFNVIQGTCVGGSPRWQIDLQDPANANNTQFLWVYFDTQHEPYGGCNAGTQQEANIIGTTSPAANGWFVGYANAPSNYDVVNTQYGSWTVSDVQVIVDGGWAQSAQINPNIQQVLLHNMKIYTKTYFPLPQ
ncbi:MAG TPA: hypothetical protein VGJ03_13670 [Acidimicrobiales bacterium]|jgi:hypothetical protein